MIRAVFLFPNGMIALTDEHGQQIAELQGPVAQVREAVGMALWKQGADYGALGGPIEFSGCSLADFPKPTDFTRAQALKLIRAELAATVERLGYPAVEFDVWWTGSR